MVYLGVGADTSVLTMEAAFSTDATALTWGSRLQPNSSLRYQDDTHHLISVGMIAPINLAEEVRSTQIIVPNPDKFRAKLAQFIEDGASNLQVVADFDQTFTRYSFNGKHYLTTFGAMQLLLAPEQLEECIRLYEHYHPLETSSTISYTEKFAHMDAWQLQAFQIMLRAPISQAELRKVLDKDCLLLRHGVDQFMTLCQQQDVKFTILSAGLGNLIDLCLEHVAAGAHAEVFANVIEFDSEGQSTRFSEPLLHSLTKPTILASKPLRKNILLLGDMPHDLLMVGHHSQDLVLSIGFFNDHERYDIADYEDKFDVLCLKDGNLEVAELITAWICGVDRPIDESPSLHSLLAYKLG
jgi:HAD superfamily hydrolase (TIGR01544 family)